MDYTPEDLKKYSRLWDDVVREANPKLWQRGVDLYVPTSISQFVPTIQVPQR